jgi:hypothetical protein
MFCERFFYLKTPVRNAVAVQAIFSWGLNFSMDVRIYLEAADIFQRASLALFSSSIKKFSRSLRIEDR